MESNNPTLGNDVVDENEVAMPDTEQTTTDVQEAAEQPVDDTTQAELQAQPDAAADDDSADVGEGGTEPALAEVAGDDAAERVAEVEPVAEPVVEAFDADDVADFAEPAADEPVAAEPAAEAFAEDEPAEPELGEDELAEPEPVEPEPLPFRKNEVVTGTVVETSPTEVLIEIADGIVGVVASRELERMDRDALEDLQVGGEVEAFVLKVRGSNGQPVLSLARAEEESNWRLAEEYYETKQVYFSKVAGYNKGGLIVRFGKVRGFVPASQVSRERQNRMSGESPEERWGHMVGEDVAVKVVEIDRQRNRLILSERAAAREWRERQKARLIEELEVGDIRTGRVISIADFGAFVDLGGADGLVHLTEISWQHITHPRDVLEVGQEVEVLVINIDRDRKRIGLSMKRREDDPWQKILSQYDTGQLVQANVTKLTKFGAFARLVDAPEIEGLIHISELADYRVSHPREVVLVGDVLTLRIVKINPEQRRLGLSLRQVDSARFMDQDWQNVFDDIEQTVDLDVPVASDDDYDDDDAPVASADYDDDDAPVASDDYDENDVPSASDDDDYDEDDVPSASDDDYDDEDDVPSASDDDDYDEYDDEDDDE